MKVGLFITNQQHTGADMVQALNDQIAMVHHARDRGWDSLLTGQHYLNEGNNTIRYVASSTSYNNLLYSNTNDYESGSFPSGHGRFDVTGSAPAFTNEASHDYTLGSSSPARNAGADNSGTSSPGMDIGAHQSEDSGGGAGGSKVVISA